MIYNIASGGNCPNNPSGFACNAHYAVSGWTPGGFVLLLVIIAVIVAVTRRGRGRGD